MEYVEVSFHLYPKEPWSDLLADALGEIGFESFMDQGEFFMAYIQKNDFDEDSMKQVWVLNEPEVQVKYELQTVPNENWNKKWEDNFQPVNVEDRCIIKASFHKVDQPFEFEILIDPKMAFGTGHHESTYLMVQSMFDVDFKEKSVLDMGSGTGVLAILAKMLHSGETIAVDNNDWAYESTKENVESNGYPEIEVILGEIETVREKKFDIVLANINRNIVYDQLPDYYNMLPAGGLLLTSGFFDYDAPSVIDKAEEVGFKLVKKNTRNNWAQIVFEK